MTRARERDRIAALFAAIALRAAGPVMRAYERDCAVRMKSDASPVTIADEEAEEVILAELAHAMPGVPIVAEERCAAEGRPTVDGDFILVDPLDGTREFVDRNGEFAISIGLVSGGEPVAGAVFAPALRRLWLGGAHARTARRAAGDPPPHDDDCRVIETRPARRGHLVALVSRSHLDARTENLLNRMGVLHRRAYGSALKFCLIAEGEADLYPRFSPTMEWDTAGGQAVLCAAGGAVLAEDGAPLRYGDRDDAFCNSGFVAWGRRPA